MESLPKKYIRKESCLSKSSKYITRSLENYFFWHGKAVSKRPEVCIVLCIVLTSLCAIGLKSLKKEEKPFRLWMPQDSEVLKTFLWKKENFPVKVRVQMVLFQSKNVLEKEVLLELLKVHNIVTKFSNQSKIPFQDVCSKVPKPIVIPYGRRRRSTIGRSRNKRKVDWFSFVFKRDYCSLIENGEQMCIEKSILELWGYDEEKLKSLTQEQIYFDVNTLNISAVFSTPFDITKFLGGIEWSKNNTIIGARAAPIVFVTKVDYEAIAKGESHLDHTGIDHPVDNLGYKWEGDFINYFSNYSPMTKGIETFHMAASSFTRINTTTVFDDAEYLAFGFLVVFIYAQIMLGKFNFIEQRSILSLFGMSCIGLSIVVSYGLCSVVGVPFGPVNTILPFLLLGLGIDDMFVIMQSWNTLSHEERKEPLVTRMGLTMKHAGVSITITSVTNFMAFAIGSTSVLPALRSFCLFAAAGILAVYFFQTTFFTAWFALDQKRLEEKRNGLLWCIKMEDHKVSKCSQRDLSQLFFETIFSRFLTRREVKVCVILLTAGVLGVSCWGFSNLKQEFNEMWFMPQDSHLFKFRMKLNEYFPDVGYPAEILFTNTSLYDDMPKIISLGNQLRESPYVDSVDSWADSYLAHIENLGYNMFDADVTKQQFLTELGEFLFTKEGFMYKELNFKMNDKLSCWDPTPNISIFSINFKWKLIYSTKDKINAMRDVKNKVDSLNFTGYVRSYSLIYASWETDSVIDEELYRNLAMAMCVVFLLTLLLITSLRTSIMVLMCVLFTMIDVGAAMHWWGLTIDVASCIDLILAIGLCVDYAAHIGHTFMTQQGTLDERMQGTLRKIGPAVLNGGFSTFLAILFLSFSKSHIFKTFYKIFFCVIVFGLYHGLVFLPVILSLFGPSAYKELTYNNNSNVLEQGPLYCEKSVNGVQSTTKLLSCEEQNDKSNESEI